MKRLLWIALLSVLVGCDALATAEVATPSPIQTPPAPTALPPRATPTLKPVPQVLRLSLANEPDSIDPQKVSFAGDIGIVMKVFSNLLTFDADGNLIPEMAADLPSLSADGLTYTFKLKPGLKYSDGQPLTARNFEYGWKRHLDPEIGGDYGFTGYVIVGGEAYNTARPGSSSKTDLQKLRDAVGVKPLDDTTLVFQLKERAPYFLSILATWSGVPTRQDMVDRGGARWTEPATYIGNGPYVLQEWTHQVQMVFAANANYQRGKPPIERIELRIVNDPSAALTAYLNGELDVVEVGAGELPQAQNDQQLKLQLKVQAGSCTSYIGFNTTRKPFDQPKVRRAFAQALDQNAYVKNVLKGMGIAAEQFVPPGLRGDYAELKPLKFDPAAAKRELAGAGYADGKGLPEIKYGYAASDRNQARALWLQAQLKDHLGVDLKLDPNDARAYSAALKAANSTPQLFLYAWCQDYPDPQDWYSVFFQSASTLSLTRWKSEPFDKLTRAADGEPEPQKRNDLYRQAAQLLVDESPAVFLAHDATPLLVKPYVEGAKISPLDYYFAANAIMRLKIVAH